MPMRGRPSGSSSGVTTRVAVALAAGHGHGRGAVTGLGQGLDQLGPAMDLVPVHRDDAVPGPEPAWAAREPGSTPPMVIPTG